MKKRNKLLLITALCLIGAGILTCTGVMAVLGFDFTKLDNSEVIENKYEYTQSINDIVIDTDTADINILPSENGKTRVICMEDNNDKHSVSLSNGRLLISSKDKMWYEYLTAFDFRSPEITIYLPPKSYNALSIDCSTGDINIEDSGFAIMEIDVSTGDIILNNITSNHIEIESATGDAKLYDTNVLKEINIETSTGHIELNSTLCEGSMEFETSTGHITFNNSDALTINAETSTGDITGTLLTGKTFYTESSTGDVKVPYTTGSPCNLETSTGDIIISIAQ